MNSTKLMEKLIDFCNENDVTADEVVMVAAAMGTIVQDAPGVRTYLQQHVKAAPRDRDWRDRTGANIDRLAKLRGWNWPKKF